MRKNKSFGIFWFLRVTKFLRVIQTSSKNMYKFKCKDQIEEKKQQQHSFISSQITHTPEIQMLGVQRAKEQKN